MSKPMKLVRDIFPPDNDPNITLTRLDYNPQLNNLYKMKVDEEVGEILNSDHKDINEFADLYEVVLCWAQMNGFSADEVIRAAFNKKLRKGGFSNRVLLTLNPDNPSNKPYFENHE